MQIASQIAWKHTGECVMCWYSAVSISFSDDIIYSTKKQTATLTGIITFSTAGVPTFSDSAFHAALKEYEEGSEAESNGKNGGSD